MPDRRRRTRIAIGAAIALLLVAAGGWLWLGVEWVEHTLDTGHGEDARRNPYLAAELFLRARGLETETVTGLRLLDRLPDTDDLLILSSSRRAISERRTRALADWVRAGGHLLVVATEPWDAERERSRDPLLDSLGARLYPISEVEEAGRDEPDTEGDEAQETTQAASAQAPAAPPSPDVGDPAAASTAATDDETPPESVRVGDLIEQVDAERACRPDDGGLAGVRYGDSDWMLWLDLDSEYHLEAVEGLEFSIDTPTRTQLVHARVGDGALTATTSLHPWRNGAIHCHDHALLLWLLARDRHKVWLLHDPDVPGVARLLAGALPLSCLAAALVLGLWGAARSLRFGQAPPALERTRRELLEHLEAASRVRWRADQLATTLETLRRSVIQQLGAASVERTVSGATPGGPSPEEVEDALHGSLPRRRTELVRRVRILQRIGARW